MEDKKLMEIMSCFREIQRLDYWRMKNTTTIALTVQSLYLKERACDPIRFWECNRVRMQRNGV